MAYSKGNFLSSPPIVSNFDDSSSGFLVIGLGTKLKLNAFIFPVAGASIIFNKSFNSAAFLMKASLVEKVIDVNYPLNPGYLFSSLPPNINLIYLVLAWTVLCTKLSISFVPYLISPTASLSSKL